MQRRANAMRNGGLWPTRGRVGALALGLWLALLVPAAGAEEPVAAEPAGAAAVPLDRLLRLPAGSGQGTAIERRGGHTKGEWQARFREARAAEIDARERIARTRTAIEEKVAKEGGGQWRMGAPGLGAQQAAPDPVVDDGLNTPLDYKLTQTLRRTREELARAERALQDLEVEANLAAVPAEWRALPPDAAAR